MKISRFRERVLVYVSWMALFGGVVFIIRSISSFILSLYPTHEIDLYYRFMFQRHLMKNTLELQMRTNLRHNEMGSVSQGNNTNTFSNAIQPL